MNQFKHASQQFAEYSEVSFNLSHVTMKGIRGGTPGGPRLLLLHGWLDNCHSFLPMSPYLEKYDWIAIDFPGHGHSGHRSTDAQYYFVDWVYDVEALIREQKWRQLSVIGHSMGGYVAQLLAATFPGSVSALVSIEAFGLVTGQPTDALEQLRKGFASRFKQQTRSLPVYADLQHLRHARAKAGSFSEALADLLLQRNLRPVEGGYSWRTDPRVRSVSPFRFSEHHVPAILRGIQAPMQVILGADGHGDLIKGLEKWQGEVASLATETLPGGHHLHMEYPEAVATAALRHLNKVTQTA